MHTVAQLVSGELTDIKRLAISENLTSFPMEILSLAESLEVLDLSGNRLTSLPAELVELKNLKIIFVSNNCFETLPEVLGQCEKLEMIGFKSNRIKHVPAAALPAKLRWLILTDNQIEALPDSLGERPRLQKLALAGNQLQHLPATLSQASNLELVRISANQLTECPDQLLDLPKLAWLAFSGNPFCRSEMTTASVPSLPANSYYLLETLGQGASGVISEAAWHQKPQGFPDKVAVKVFKGSVTSDGYPEDELQACLKAGDHPNLIRPLAEVNEQGYLALIMELIPAHYRNLGLPPTLQSCTRDTFPEDFSLGVSQIGKIVQQMESVFEHLHANHVCHGDLYAHNTLVNESNEIIFGDFGAASMYHMLTENQKKLIRRIERRALVNFIEDLLSICKAEDKLSPEFTKLSLLSR